MHLRDQVVLHPGEDERIVQLSLNTCRLVGASAVPGPAFQALMAPTTFRLGLKFVAFGDGWGRSTLSYTFEPTHSSDGTGQGGVARGLGVWSLALQGSDLQIGHPVGSAWEKAGDATDRYCRRWLRYKSRGIQYYLGNPG